MKYDDVVQDLPSNREFELRAEYFTTCPCCKKEIKIFAQQDNDPEYYAIIYVVCMKCEELVKFKIPIN